MSPCISFRYQFGHHLLSTHHVEAMYLVQSPKFPIPVIVKIILIFKSRKNQFRSKHTRRENSKTDMNLNDLRNVNKNGPLHFHDHLQDNRFAKTVSLPLT